MKTLILIFLTSLCVTAYAEDTPSFSDSDILKKAKAGGTITNKDLESSPWKGGVDTSRSATIARKNLDGAIEALDDLNSDGGVYHQALNKANNRIDWIKRRLDKNKNEFFKHDRLSGSRRKALEKELRQLQRLLPVLIARAGGDFQSAREIEKRNKEVVSEEAAEGKKESERRKTIHSSKKIMRSINGGAIDVETGEFYPQAGKGITDPKTGQYYPPAGYHGYTNPQTGEFIPTIK